MPFSITPSLGIDLERDETGLPYYDAGRSVPSPQLGSRVHGSDGYEWIFVEAGAAIASAETAVVIDPDTFVATAGAGNFQTMADGVADGDYIWVRIVDAGFAAAEA